MPQTTLEILSDMIYLIDKGLNYFNQFKRDRRLSPHNQCERISALTALDMASKMAKRVRDRLEEDPVPPTPSEVAELLADCRSGLATATQSLEAILESTETGSGIRIELMFSVGSENCAAQGSPCYRPTSP
jgi:hypothetical protein